VAPNKLFQAAPHPLGALATFSSSPNIDHHAEVGKRQQREKDDIGSTHTARY
jgi:hypothetical protein